MIHLINIVSFFLLTISSIYLPPFDLAQFLAASYALDNIFPNKATISVATISSIVPGRISTTNPMFSVQHFSVYSLISQSIKNVIFRKCRTLLYVVLFHY